MKSAQSVDPTFGCGPWAALSPLEVLLLYYFGIRGLTILHILKGHDGLVQKPRAAVFEGWGLGASVLVYRYSNQAFCCDELGSAGANRGLQGKRSCDERAFARQDILSLGV